MGELIRSSLSAAPSPLSKRDLMKILVAHKKSRYQKLVVEREDPHVADLIAQKDASVASFERAHQRHTESVERVVEVLERARVPFELVAREDVSDPDHVDLVVSVGGDGTVLDLSHKLTWTPVLGINSDPDRSVGYFCAGTAHDFEALLRRTLDGRWQPASLKRFALDIGEVRTPPVLNEILVCHANPAAVSSYLFRVDGHTESQRSSGIWLSTPAGSTAAIRSAGGMVLPISSHNFQFVVREPYASPKRAYRQVRGIRPFGAEVEIISRMEEGRVYVDGPHMGFPFPIGERLTLDFEVPDLKVYGLDDARRNA